MGRNRPGKVLVKKGERSKNIGGKKNPQFLANKMVFLDFWLIKLWNSRKMPCRKPTHPRNCLGKYHGITVKLSVSSMTVFGIALNPRERERAST